MRISIERATYIDNVLSVDARVRGREVCRVYMVCEERCRFECTCEDRELCKEAEKKLKEMYGV